MVSRSLKPSQSTVAWPLPGSVAARACGPMPAGSTCSEADMLMLQGDDAVDKMADRIAKAHGPSGPNHEYLSKLVQALKQVHVPAVQLLAGSTCFGHERKHPPATYANKYASLCNHVPAVWRDALATARSYKLLYTCLQMDVEEPELYELNDR